jgi:hypothetical protein
MVERTIRGGWPPGGPARAPSIGSFDHISATEVVLKMSGRRIRKKPFHNNPAIYK